MNAKLTAATARRVLLQLKADKRTIAMLILLPMLLLTLLWWLFGDTIDPLTQAPMFDPLGARLMGLFPMLLMFIITSVATLRERTSGTMERLMASPMRRGDVVLGYAMAFGLVAAVQGTLLTLYSVYVLSLDVEGPVWALVLIIVLDALLGTALGLAASSLARTEFQAVQMMPVVLLPQLLIAGLFMAREDMPDVLYWISTVLPLSYAIDAINDILANDAAGIWPEVLILVGFIAGSLILGVTTLRRRTP